MSAGFHRWEAAIRRGYDAMQSRGTLAADLDVERLATATLAAVQGGLLLCQMHRTTAPLEAALDTMITHVESLTVRPAG